MQQGNNAHSAKKTSRWWLYGPFIIGAILFAIYGMVWKQGAKIMHVAVDDWIADQRAAGMTITHGAVDIKGFPFFLRAEVADPYIGWTDEWAWFGPKLLIEVSPVKPDRLIFIPIGTQGVTCLDKNYTLTADKIFISLKEDAIGFDVAAAALTDDATQKEALNIGQLKFNSLTVAGEVNEKGNILPVTSLVLDGRDIRVQDGEVSLVLPLVEMASLVTAIDYILAGEARSWQHLGGHISMQHFRVFVDDEDTAPPTQVSVKGNISLDDNQYPVGSIVAGVKDPEALLDILLRYGVVTQKDAEAAAVMITSLESQTYTLKDGKVKMGLIPLPVELPKIE